MRSTVSLHNPGSKLLVDGTKERRKYEWDGMVLMHNVASGDQRGIAPCLGSRPEIPRNKMEFDLSEVLCQTTLQQRH